MDQFKHNERKEELDSNTRKEKENVKSKNQNKESLIKKKLNMTMIVQQEKRNPKPSSRICYKQ
jgi:hypothetical protein